jgi:MFS family permease
MEPGQKGGLDWGRLFRLKGFPQLFVAMFVSLFGTGLNFAGTTWYVLDKTGSTVATAMVTVLVTIPGLIVPPFGGVLIDRVDRRYLGIALDLLRGAVVLLTAIVLALGRAEVWHIYAMVLLLGVGFSIYWSTTHALIQEVTGGKELVSANSAVLIAVQGGMMTAGAVVGFLYEHIHLSGILTLDGLTYLVSAFCLLNLRSGYHPPHAHEQPASAAANGQAEGKLADVPSSEQALFPVPEPEPQLDIASRFVADLREGFRYLRSQPRVLALGLTYACMMAGVLSGNVLIAALTMDVLKAGPRGFGYMEAGWAFGAVAGGLLIGKLMQRHSPALLLILALGTLAAGHAVFPYVTLLAVAVAMNALFGLCRALGGVLTQSSIMNLVPRRLMGRTQSAFSVIATTLQILMSLCVGWLAQHLNLPLAFAALGAIYGVATFASTRVGRTAGEAPPAAGA